MNGLQIAHFGLNRQYKNLKDELLNATNEVLKEGQLVSGSFTRSFEDWLKNKTNTKYAVTVHSGTQALEIIALFKKQQHLEVRQGIPKIRIPNLTYPATLTSFLKAGWEVELADTDKTGILNHDVHPGVYQCLVGLYGKLPWPNTNYSDSFGVIVDGAQHWLVAGDQIGSGMAISFDPTKNLPCSGNGGAIVTNSEKMYLFASSYKNNNKPYFHDVGTNSKMSELECAHILVRSQYIDEWQSRRQYITDYWINCFKNLPITCLNKTEVPHANQKFVLYVEDRNSLQNHLLLAGVDSKFHYEYTLGDLPISRELDKPDLLSTSIMLSRGVISLPLYPELSDIEVEYIAQKVEKFYM